MEIGLSLMAVSLFMLLIAIFVQARGRKKLDVDIAYAHGIRVGQQMIMSSLMPSPEKCEESRLACAELIREADEKGWGKTLKSLDDYRL